MPNDEQLREEQPNRYFDPHFKVDTAKILPGEYYATNKDMALVTVLGSCVSACLRDRETGIGGMNHFMLPEEGKLVGSHGNITAGGRYGVHARRAYTISRLASGSRIPENWYMRSEIMRKCSALNGNSRLSAIVVMQRSVPRPRRAPCA